MEHLVIAATLFLGLFAVVAGIDGLYFHLWKYRLYSRPESIYEHKLHTIRAFLFIPIVFTLFVENFAGMMLWLGVLVILADLVVEMIDVFSERGSRAQMGGLSSAEYAVHVLATTLRISAIALVLAAKPLYAWRLSSSITVEGNYPNLARSVAVNIIMGNFVVGALHVWLMRKRYRSEERAAYIKG